MCAKVLGCGKSLRSHDFDFWASETTYPTYNYSSQFGRKCPFSRKTCCQRGIAQNRARPGPVQCRLAETRIIRPRNGRWVGLTVAETLRSSGKVSAAVGLSRVLGLVREQILAALFGASFFADAFAVAFRIPNLLRDLFAEGALSSALVPTFTDALVKEDRDAAYRLGRLVFTAILLITGVLTLLGVVFAEEIVVDVGRPWRLWPKSGTIRL